LFFDQRIFSSLRHVGKHPYPRSTELDDRVRLKLKTPYHDGTTDTSYAVFPLPPVDLEMKVKLMSPGQAPNPCGLTSWPKCLKWFDQM
jgi:hypothetical protein